MILVETSAAIEGSRDRSGLFRRRLNAMFPGEPWAVARFTRMEILAGARDPRHRQMLETFLLRGWILLDSAPNDYDEAARIYSELRWRGITVSGVADCLIAQAALVRDIPLVHCDRDFEAVARIRPALRQVRLESD